MRRREFIALVAGSVAWPLASHAQQPRVRKIGVFYGLTASDPEWHRRFEQFKGGLEDLGWIVTTNIEFEVRHAQGNPEQLRALAAQLLEANVELIVVQTAGLATIVHNLSRTIPIVALSPGELEGTGLIASLRSPGGNVTGNQIFSSELMGKRVQLLKAMVPKLTRLGVIHPVSLTGFVVSRYHDVIQAAAHGMGIEVHRVDVETGSEFIPAFHKMAREGIDAVLVIAAPLTLVNQQQIVTAASQSRLPTIYEVRQFAAAGGLMSFGADILRLHRTGAGYVDRILKGAHPGSLPIQQPTKFELVINAKTAKALGLAIPPTLLALADEVIE